MTIANLQRFLKDNQQENVGLEVCTNLVRKLAQDALQAGVSDIEARDIENGVSIEMCVAAGSSCGGLCWGWRAPPHTVAAAPRCVRLAGSLSCSLARGKSTGAVGSSCVQDTLTDSPRSPVVVARSAARGGVLVRCRGAVRAAGTTRCSHRVCAR